MAPLRRTDKAESFSITKNDGCFSVFHMDTEWEYGVEQTAL